MSLPDPKVSAQKRFFGRITSRHLCVLALPIAVVASPASAASLNIKGDLQVQGDGAQAAGNLTANGNGTVNGTLTVQGSMSVAGSGTVANDLEVGRNTNLKRFIETYTLITSSQQSTKTKPMGAWDLCFLSEVTMAGIDDKSSSSASCVINVSQGYQATRPNWTLQSVSGNSNVDNVACSSTCISFTTTRTGAQ